VWKRLWYLARGIFYAFLCYTTVAILFGSHSGSSEKRHTEELFEWPLGRWIVGAIGVGVFAWGLGSAWRAISRDFKDDLHTERMSETTKRWTTRAGVVGYGARAVVFILIGIFIARAAWEYDPDEAVGLDGALQRSSRTRPSGRSCSGSSPPGSPSTGSSISSRLLTGSLKPSIA
jgi:hypothetical protein